MEELQSSRSVCGKDFPNFEMLDANADLFSVVLHDDNIQEFGTRWDEVLLSVSRIPSGDFLESLYKLRIRV